METLTIGKLEELRDAGYPFDSLDLTLDNIMSECFKMSRGFEMSYKAPWTILYSGVLLSKDKTHIGAFVDMYLQLKKANATTEYKIVN